MQRQYSESYVLSIIVFPVGHFLAVEPRRQIESLRREGSPERRVLRPRQLAACDYERTGRRAWRSRPSHAGGN